VRTLLVAVVASLPLSLLLGGAVALGQEVKAQDTKGTPDERAALILKQLTQDEKISLLSGNQFVTHAIERLGIPAFAMSDGPQGVRNGPGSNRACAFPCGAALAATWDADLAAAYGKAVGLEGRARGTNFQLGPGLNICRVPVNGRNFEYFGEDPYLAGIIATRWTKACSETGVVPTIKHFAANNQEVNRNSVDTIVDERTLHEIYLPAFKRAVQEGGTVAVMCSYNRLNGSYASNNDWLQNQVLKQQWGFKGLVMSDWGASHNVTDVAKGLDLEMPSGANLNARNIPGALQAGTVKQSDIDNAVQRLLRTAFAMGWLDNGWAQKNPNLPLDSADSAKVAQNVAEASVVLLKNAGSVLPLDRTKVRNIVVIGPNATAGAEAAFGGGGRGGARRGGGGAGRGAAATGRGAAGPQAPANLGGGGSGAVTPYETHNAEADYLQGITKAAGDAVKVTYLPVTPAANPGDPPTMPDAAQLKAADVVIVCAGLNRNSEAEGRDRAFDLPQLQQDLIKLATDANPRTVIINNSGAAVGILSWQEKAAAILQAWYLGQEGGVAVGRILFGDVNPSGRLCSTFDKVFEDNPAFANYPGKPMEGQNYPTVKYEEGLFYGYRGYDKAAKDPLYPFGYGLSYTSFELSNLSTMVVARGVTTGSVEVTLDVKNTGSRAGADVVEVYVGEQNAALPRPARELKGFSKLTLNPGETKRVQISLPFSSFAYWSPERKDWVTDMANAFTVEAGHSERDLKLKQAVSLK
jgi:beta-glucosidase